MHDEKCDVFFSCFLSVNEPQQPGIKQKWFLLVLKAPGQHEIGHCRNMQQLHWPHLFNCRLTHFANPPITRQPPRPRDTVGTSSHNLDKIKLIEVCGASYPCQGEYRRSEMWTPSNLVVWKGKITNWLGVVADCQQHLREERQLLSLSP